MENAQKKTNEEPKIEKLPIQNIEPAGENLSEAELDNVAGGVAKLLGSSSNIKNNVAAKAVNEGGVGK